MGGFEVDAIRLGIRPVAKSADGGAGSGAAIKRPANGDFLGASRTSLPRFLLFATMHRVRRSRLRSARAAEHAHTVHTIHGMRLVRLFVLNAPNQIALTVTARTYSLYVASSDSP